MELARRCLAGDAAALREFVQAYQQQVFALCYRMLGHRQDAEDTAQDSLVRALKYLRTWDSTQPLTPWVMKIAANRCRTAMGKRARLPVSTEVDYRASTANDDRFALGEELQLALEVLQEQQRTCFVLFYQQELSIAEIGEIMQTPAGTIKTWLHRSRKLLAQRLRERGLAPDREPPI
ncbi:RNA polymerase sigma factor [Planctomicrobium piriforme]|uniref:RNA polymerase sigma-70 factor, ECF subfamily n=1 Tax=Planctomicrobium piriforme TaxID=1576369 RepID=A0A1I3KZR9_9PLAN|nr:sigma-70 family RNA polymerase sigma factor [Planctomicrobium piriforme]SFI77828.1 RNA polymerase sigma-70 factor, ECF subfamily [Planctomicrobium piriforme]